jgi:hypothetical protein
MAQPAVIQLEVESGDALAELEQVEQGLEEVDIAAVEAGDGFERLTAEVTQEAAESRSQIQLMASATRDMGSASSTANNLTFELTNQLQDMQAAGLQGATNAIPMLSEQFVRLKNQAGSTTGALSQMLSTFTGPTGILAIGTLGLQALPSVIDFFSGVREEAEKTSEEVKNLKEATDQLITGFESELPDFQIADTGQARRSVEGLEQSIQSREQLIEDLEEALRAAGAEQAQLSREAARFANLTDQTIQKLIRRNKRVIEQERGLRRAIQDRLDRREDEVGQAELLKDTQGIVVKQSEDRVKNAQDSADATEREARAMNALAVSAKEVAENRQAVNQFFAQGGRRERLFRQFNFGRTPTVGGTMLNQGQSQGALMLQSGRQAGIISQFQDAQLGGSAREPGRAPQGSGATGTPGLKAISMSLSEIQEKFDVSKKKAKQFKKEAKRQVGQIVSAVGSLGSALATVFQDGEKSAKEFASAALSGIGGVISAIPGVGQIAGPAFSAAGQLVGSFEHGGEVEAPVQLVGEEGPELVSLPAGSRVADHESSTEIIRMIKRASEGRALGEEQMRTQAADRIPTARGGTPLLRRSNIATGPRTLDIPTFDPSGPSRRPPQVSIKPQVQASQNEEVIEKLDEVARRVETMDVRIDAFAANAELGRSQSQLERAGDTVYPQKG